MAWRNQVIEELERKGLSHLLKMGNNTSVTVAPTKAAQPIQPSLPVHYHTNVFGSVGNGYEMLESVNTKVMWFRSSFFNLLGAPLARCFCTHVRGESMHPTLIDKGTVMWQMQNSYTIEGIYLFRQVNELRIKRLQRVNSHTYRIISDNKEFYPVETLDLRDMESHKFEIYGKYLWDCAIRP